MSERGESSGAAFWEDADDIEALQRCRALVNTIDDGIYQLDAEDRFIAVNDGIVELTGYARDELLGNHVSALLDDEDVSTIEHEIERLRTNTADRSELLYLTVQTTEGEQVRCEVRMNLLEAEDISQGTVGIVRETTEQKQRDENPSEREQELEARSAAMEETVDGIAILDENEKYVFANQAHADIYGYDDPESLLGETWRLCYDDEEIDRLEAAAMPVLLEEGNWRGEATGMRKNGSTFPQELSLTVLDDGRHICIVRDITEQREREHELERYETLFRESRDVNGVLAPDGTFEYLTPSAAGVLGYDPEELVGENAFDYVHPEDRERVAEMFTKMVENPEREPKVEYRFEHADGSWVVLESRGRNLLDEPNVEGIVVYSRDVTQRKEREQNLRETREQLEVATSAGSVGVWTWDIQENVLTADEYLAETYGMDPGQAAAGAPIEVFFEPIYEEDRERVWQKLDEAVDESGEFEAEYRVRDADDDTTWVVSRAEVEYNDGEPIRMHGAISDITERKRREQLFVEQKELLEHIASGAALEECLSELCNTVSRLNPGVRASILLADDDCESFEQSIAPDHSQSWGEGLEGAPINDLMIGTCGTAVFRGDSITCEDVANDDRWSKEWRDVCIANGVQAGHSEPILDTDGDPEGSFMLCFDEPRGPNEWEQRLIEFGTHIASVALDRDRSRQALQESEERYRTLFESIDEGFCIVEILFDDGQPEDYRFLETNPAFEEQTGLVDAEGKRMRELEPGHEEHWFETYGRIAQTGEPERFTHEAEYLDDRWYDVYAFPIGQSAERKVAILFNDITERKERERKLEESEHRYRTLIENFPNGAVALFDEDLRYRVAGGDIHEHLDLSTEEVVGQTVWERYPEEFAERLEPNFRAAVEENETNKFEIEFHDRHWRAYTLPVRDSEGDVFAGMMMVQDVTEQVERERYLSDAKAQLEAAAEAGAVGTWEWHIPDDRFVTGASFARKFGVDPEAARDGVPLERLVSSIHEADRERVEARIEEAVESCGEYEEEYRVWNADNELRWVVARGHVECDEDGNPITFPGALTDITELKQFEQQLEESNERLEQFAYVASHDLQEPLRMVTSYLQLLENRYQDELDEDAQEFIDFAVNGAERMRDMIEGLLEYARVETQGDPFEPVNLEAVLEDARENLQIRIEETETTITMESLPHIQGDAAQLRQVFQNLLSNAIEYAGDEPPHVQISAERNTDKWVVSVRDEGVGIDPDDADRIFEVFQSLHGQSDHSGTGIGLALCERIVERHNGEIWVESEPGEGATFSFTLPDEGENDE